MKNVFIFIGGAAIGSAITWKLLDAKYRKIADEEIASVIDMFKKKEKLVTEISSDENTSEEKTETVSYSTIIKSNYCSSEENEENYTVSVPDLPERTMPYIISPSDFGEMEDYGTKSLTYYADGVLTDEIDDIITDPDNIIGPEALSHFGEYEDDSVYVRDDDNEIDYEILKSEKNFSEIDRG